MAAVRRRQVEWLATGDYRSGLNEGATEFARVIHGSPSLRARMINMLARTEQALAHALAEETDASPSDVTPRVAASQLVGVTRVLQIEITERLSAGESAEDIRPDMIDVAERAFDIAAAGIGDYCTRQL